MTTSVASNTPSWVASLADADVKADFLSLTSNGSFSYSAALTLLDNVAAHGTVTAAEFASLQTIAANLGNGVSTSDYVTSIFTQLVDGSPQNAAWTGGAMAASWDGPVPSVTLGNLAVGTSATNLGDLIGKWFLGTDLPSATGEGNSSGQSLQPTYQAFAQPLFDSSGQPAIADVNQGDSGDCELCAGMIDMVVNHASALESMFVSDGNGVYGVRFYVGGKAMWVTVNDQLPVYQGALLYNDASVLWASLIEKAYAQLSSSGLIDQAPVNSYSNISGDYAFDVLEDLNNSSSVMYYYSLDKDWNGYKNVFVNAIAAGNDLILESNGDTYDSSGRQELVSNHAFAVIGYDAATGDFIVRNPWGASPDNSYDAQFEVSMANIASVNGDMVIDNSATPNVIVTTLGQLTTAGQSNSYGEFLATGQYLPAGSVTALSSLFTTMDLSGARISAYMVQAIGLGGVQLNGATNLATAAQQALGEIVVAAADLSKLTFAAGATVGSTDLLVSAYDGVAWSTATDVALTISAKFSAAEPVLNAVVAPSASLPIASLFSVIGSPGANLSYLFSLENDVGTITLNGAANLLAHGQPGQVEVHAADLAALTFTAPSTAPSANDDQVFLDVTIYNGGTPVSDLIQVPIMIGTSVSTAVQDFNAGQISFSIAITDSAANVSGNLDSLQKILSAGDISGIALTDSGTPTLATTAGQSVGDSAALHAIVGNFAVSIAAGAGSTTLAGISGHASTAVFSGTAGQYTMTPGGDGVSFTVSAGGAVDHLSNITALQFSDYTDIVASQTPPVGGVVSSAMVTELYGAVFGRTPDAGGLAYYQAYAAAHPSTPFLQFAEWFLASPEYADNSAHAYAQTSAGDAQFITACYGNLLHRAPASTEVAWYEAKVIDPMLVGFNADTTAYAAAETQAHAQVLVYFSQSAEFLNDVQVTAQHPSSAQHWLVLI